MTDEAQVFNFRDYERKGDHGIARKRTDRRSTAEPIYDDLTMSRPDPEIPYIAPSGDCA